MAPVPRACPPGREAGSRVDAPVAARRWTPGTTRPTRSPTTAWSACSSASSASSTLASAPRCCGTPPSARCGTRPATRSTARHQRGPQRRRPPSRCSRWTAIVARRASRGTVQASQTRTRAACFTQGEPRASLRVRADLLPVPVLDGQAVPGPQDAVLRRRRLPLLRAVRGRRGRVRAPHSSWLGCACNSSCRGGRAKALCLPLLAGEAWRACSGAGHMERARTRREQR